MALTSGRALAVEGVRKRYGAVEALAGVDLEVARGEIFAFLGPNGAGKTTLVEILEGYRSRDEGEVEVLGRDPTTAGRGWRGRIGIVLQTSEMPPELTAREAVRMYAGFYPDPLGEAEVLSRVGLDGHADRRIGRFSGGQKRRLDLGLGIVGRPELLFLDEPTTGLDPEARRATWDLIREFRDIGTTVFLTTHYMEEAEALADRLAIIVAGAIVADGTLAELAGESGASTITWVASGAPAALATRARRDGDRFLLESDDAVADVEVLLAWSRENGVPPRRLEIRRPTLEDIYLDLTREVA